MITKVLLTKKVLKQLHVVPDYIAKKLDQWIESVEEIGIEEVRKISGFHDEPLKGARSGQRSIRLNRSYRAIYVMKSDFELYIEIIEVSNHDY